MGVIVVAVIPGWSRTTKAYFRNNCQSWMHFLSAKQNYRKSYTELYLFLILKKRGAVHSILALKQS